MTYTVRAGDTLSAIASRYGFTLAQVEEANRQIRDPSLIYPGEQVFLPLSPWDRTTLPGSKPKANPVPQKPGPAIQQKVDTAPLPPAQRNGQIAWGARVSAAFKAKVIQIAAKLQAQPDYLMAAMAFESGESFSPSIRNAAGSGATGLIQFMPSTATGLGTSTSALSQMTAVEQLDWVYRYLMPYRGRMNTVQDVYMAILFPAAVDKPNDHVLFSRTAQPETYKQNAGLDTNHDGVVTKAEAASRVVNELVRGRQPGYLG